MRAAPLRVLFKHTGPVPLCGIPQHDAWTYVLKHKHASDVQREIYRNDSSPRLSPTQPTDMTSLREVREVELAHRPPRLIPKASCSDALRRGACEAPPPFE